MGIGKALRGRLERGGPPPALPGSGALDSASRVAVYRAVVEAPGIGVRDVSRRVGRGETSVRYHLRRLSKAGIVAVEGGGPASGAGQLAIVPKGVYEEAALELLALVNGPRGVLVTALSDAPGANASELSRRTGVSADALSEALSELASQGRVRRVRDGRSTRHFLSDSLAEARRSMRGGAKRARDRLVGILQSEVPGLLSVSGRGGRVVAECPWGVEVFNLPFE